MHIRIAVAASLVALSTWSLSGQAGKNLIGYCVGLKGLEIAKAAGFDYVELGTTELTALSDADFEAAVAQVKAVGIPTPNANLFLPATLKVTGPEAATPEQQMAYVTKAFTRLERLGVKILCFGSGGARRVPDGFPKDEAFAQLVAFGKRIAPEAKAHGITVVIEPLRRQETNIINTAAEGFALVKAVGHPNFELLVDFYHLASEQEDPKIMVEAKDHLRHLHMANPQGRVFPLTWDEFDYAPFFATLRAIGYTGRMSIEASSPDVPAQAPRSIALLRKAFAGELAGTGAAARADPSGVAGRRRERRQRSGVVDQRDREPRIREEPPAIVVRELDGDMDGVAREEAAGGPTATSWAFTARARSLNPRLAVTAARSMGRSWRSAFSNIQLSAIQLSPRLALPPPTSEWTPRNQTSRSLLNVLPAFDRRVSGKNARSSSMAIAW